MAPSSALLISAHGRVDTLPVDTTPDEALGNVRCQLWCLAAMVGIGNTYLTQGHLYCSHLCSAKTLYWSSSLLGEVNELASRVVGHPVTGDVFLTSEQPLDAWLQRFRKHLVSMSHIPPSSPHRTYGGTTLVKRTTSQRQVETRWRATCDTLCTQERGHSSRHVPPSSPVRCLTMRKHHPCSKHHKCSKHHPCSTHHKCSNPSSDLHVPPRTHLSHDKRCCGPLQDKPYPPHGHPPTPRPSTPHRRTRPPTPTPSTPRQPLERAGRRCTLICWAW